MPPRQPREFLVSTVSSITIAPQPESWATLLSPSQRHPPSQESRRFRSQLGLTAGTTSDKPVIMSGHQAAFWHMGITAKWLALHHAGQQLGASTAWLVVDHDPEDFSGLSVPLRDVAGTLALQHIELAPLNVAESIRAGVPPCLIEPFDPNVRTIASPGESAASVASLGTFAPLLQTAASALAGAKANHTGHSAAMQVATAAQSLLNDAAGISVAPGKLFPVTALHTTDLFVSLINKMAESLHSAAACAAAYNLAIAASPHSRLTPLVCDVAKGRVELPLWHLDPATGIRKRVFLHTMLGLRPQVLAPRALLLTGILRWAACDLFIHGLGGGATAQPATPASPHDHTPPGDDAAAAAALGGYDRAAEAWFSDWLGATLCPSVVVTATVRLDLGNGQVATPQDAAAARWRAHRARHDPAMTGDDAVAAEKSRLIGEIARATPGTMHRLGLYKQLQSLLTMYRATHAAPLAELARQADRIAQLAATSSIATDRTYSFILHGPDGIQKLSAALQSDFSVLAAASR